MSFKKSIFIVFATGMILSYASTLLAIGPYVDTGVIILDQATGLIWQKYFPDTNKDGLIDTYDLLALPESMAWCENLVLNGYNDWRLPNVKELFSISVNDGRMPAIDDIFSLGPQNTREGSQQNVMNYWSSTRSVSNTSPWFVDFSGYGQVLNHHTPTYASFRCVRGGLVNASHQSLFIDFKGNGSGKVQVSTSATECSTTCSKDFTAGTNVILAPVADIHSTFQGWSDGACKGSTQCTVQMNETKAVTAMFSKRNIVPIYLLLISEGAEKNKK